MARIRLFLLAVTCWLCLVPAAHAIRPQTPAELQLKEETPCQPPLAYWPESMLDAEMRNGLFCVNNPLRYTDPDGHWGQEAADWWSGTVGSGANYISASPSHWIYNGTVGTVNSLVGGLAAPLGLGSSAGSVSGNPNARAKDYAIATVTEAANAAAIIPVTAGAGKAVSTLVRAGEREAAGGLAGAAGQAAGKAGGAANQAGGAAAQTTSKVNNLLQQIEQSGAKVKLNPKTASQEGNVTLDFGQQGRVNVRVETHPLTPNGPPVRHANVQTVTETAGEKNVKNIHITQ